MPSYQDSKGRVDKDRKGRAWDGMTLGNKVTGIWGSVPDMRLGYTNVPQLNGTGGVRTSRAFEADTGDRVLVQMEQKPVLEGLSQPHSKVSQW